MRRDISHLTNPQRRYFIARIHGSQICDIQAIYEYLLLELERIFISIDARIVALLRNGAGRDEKAPGHFGFTGDMVIFNQDHLSKQEDLMLYMVELGLPFIYKFSRMSIEKQTDFVCVLHRFGTRNSLLEAVKMIGGSLRNRDNKSPLTRPSVGYQRRARHTSLKVPCCSVDYTLRHIGYYFWDRARLNSDIGDEDDDDFTDVTILNLSFPTERRNRQERWSVSKLLEGLKISSEAIHSIRPERFTEDEWMEEIRNLEF